VVELRQAFLNHRHGKVKLVGVSLRVFFNPTAPFYQVIATIASIGQNNPDVSIKALLSHPKSPEVVNRAAIETPDKGATLTEKEIALTAANIDNLRRQFSGSSIEYGYYKEAPYCTLVVFPDKCFFSLNLLSKVVPVRLPMIVFRSGSHGYTVLDEYFKYLWRGRMTLEDNQPNLKSNGK